MDEPNRVQEKYATLRMSEIMQKLINILRGAGDERRTKSCVIRILVRIGLLHCSESALLPEIKGEVEDAARREWAETQRG